MTVKSPSLIAIAQLRGSKEVNRGARTRFEFDLRRQNGESEEAPRNPRSKVRKM